MNDKVICYVKGVKTNFTLGIEIIGECPGLHDEPEFFKDKLTEFVVKQCNEAHPCVSIEIEKATDFISEQ